MALVQLEDVTVAYGDLVALDGVSCALEGGAVGLLGPNGAGKSTLVKTLLGFNRARSGLVQVFGLDMPRNALDVRRQVGYMPEQEITSPKISAVAFLTYLGELVGMTRVDAMERTHEVLNYVGIGESRYRKMQTFSTGMLQRVKLAQALVHDPKLLLLDEPTNGLDPRGRQEMLELIREIARDRKVTILLSSHLLPDVQQVCEEVIIIKGGRVVRKGVIDDLTAMLERRYEVRVRDNQAAFVSALEAAGFHWQRMEDGGLLVTQPDHQDPRILFEVARDQHTQVRHFRAARSSLAEVFMEAVAEE